MPASGAVIAVNQSSRSRFEKRYLSCCCRSLITQTSGLHWSWVEMSWAVFKHWPQIIDVQDMFYWYIALLSDLDMNCLSFYHDENKVLKRVWWIGLQWWDWVLQSKIETIVWLIGPADSPPRSSGACNSALKYLKSSRSLTTLLPHAVAILMRKWVYMPLISWAQVVQACRQLMYTSVVSVDALQDERSWRKRG